MNDLRYISYCRKSTESSDKQAYSLQDQKAEIEKVVMAKGLNIVKQFSEERSAKTPGRRIKFNEMVELLNKGKANAIVCWHLNRLSRNHLEGGQLCQMIDDGKIKEIVTADGQIYSNDTDPLVLGVNFGMSTAYSKKLSKDVRRGLQYKAERGQYPRPAPMGYKGVGDPGNRTIEPDENESPMIRLACDLARQGKSLGYISEYLYQKGLRSKLGCRISKSQWQKTLTDPVLCGQFVWKGELYQGNFIPILTKTEFDQVQEALNDKSKPKIKSWKHWTNGLLFCPTCGCQVTTTGKVKHYLRTNREATYFYLRCTRKRPCHEKPITKEEFEKQLLPIIDLISIDEETWRLGLDIAHAMNQQEAERHLATGENVKRQSDIVSKRIERLNDMYLDKLISREEFISKKNDLTKELALLKEAFNNSNNQQQSWLELVEKFAELAYHARNILLNGTSEEKRNLILDLGSNLKLQDKKVIFEFKRPFDLLLRPNCSNLLPRWNDIANFFKLHPDYYFHSFNNSERVSANI